MEKLYHMQMSAYLMTASFAYSTHTHTLEMKTAVLLTGVYCMCTVWVKFKKLRVHIRLKEF